MAYRRNENWIAIDREGELNYDAMTRKRLLAIIEGEGESASAYTIERDETPFQAEHCYGECGALYATAREADAHNREYHGARMGG